ncbi:hypothetical protein BurJ1DRAFT_2564 [Burkholderiales bacterium JOSHI_001]|nr:hypothetical protein BurJ1DRAFT_2564 [Burkholderiales bacterium JOSHI_001]
MNAVSTVTAAQQAVDYLGHPSQLAEAAIRFEEALNSARELKRHALAREIGHALMNLADRGMSMGNALEVLQEVLPNDTDSDKARSVLEMAQAYDVESENVLFKLGGLVLAALEHGGLTDLKDGALSTRNVEEQTHA